MQIIDPVNNPATVALSTLIPGDCFTKYDVDAGVQLHYIVIATGQLKLENMTVTNWPASTQVVSRPNVSITFGV